MFYLFLYVSYSIESKMAPLWRTTLYPAIGLQKVTYCLCVHSVTPGDVGAVGSPLIRVCGEAPWVFCSIGVTAVVLSEVPETNAPATI